jgi:hypothetical protein
MAVGCFLVQIDWNLSCGVDMNINGRLDLDLVNLEFISE